MFSRPSSSVFYIPLGSLYPLGWCHVVCALYIPQVWFANVQTMEPIVLSGIPHESFNKVRFTKRVNEKEILTIIFISTKYFSHWPVLIDQQKKVTFVCFIHLSLYIKDYAVAE